MPPNNASPPYGGFEDGDLGEGLLYCKSRSLEEAAGALARRFISLRENEQKTKNQNFSLPRMEASRAHVTNSDAAATQTDKDVNRHALHPFSSSSSSPMPPFVRHAEASRYVATSGSEWEAVTEQLLLEDTSAVAAFVRAEVAAVVDAARSLEANARRHDDNAQAEAHTVTALRTAEDLAQRVEAASALLSHNVEAVEYVLARWATAFAAARGKSGKSDNDDNDNNGKDNCCSSTMSSGSHSSLDSCHSSMRTSSSSSFVTGSPSSSPPPPPRPVSSPPSQPSPPTSPTLPPPLARAAATLDTLAALHVEFDAAVLSLSAAFAAVRARENPDGVDSDAGVEWDPPSSFERKTTKYWVDPRDVVRLKLAVAKHLPVLVYNGCGGRSVAGKGDEHAKGKATAATVTAAPIGRDSGMITSVYFDNPNLDVYHTRLERLQGATLVRARWYGENPDLRGVQGDHSHRQQCRQPQPQSAENHSNSDNSGNFGNFGSGLAQHDGRCDVRGDVFVERKTHHESWSLDGSVKERFRLGRTELAGYLSGRLDITGRFRNTGTAEDEKAAGLAEEVLEWELRGRSLGPSLR